MVKCQYQDDCISHPTKCNTCRHNTSKKKDYYEPDGYWPYDPPSPWIPHYKWDYWCGGDK